MTKWTVQEKERKRLPIEVFLALLLMLAIVAATRIAHEILGK